MDDLLPSYESVVQQNPWELVAQYLPSDDLCSAALVCQKWHEIFTPQLWGNPASHFGVENDTVYVALTRFKRTLYWARLFVRELTHTLHLPPAHAEIYGGPHAEWLRDCLERLPRLQCLIVNGLPFFDHASLLTLKHSSLWWRSTRPNRYPVFGLRLLDAAGCKNTTSTSLAEALPHFPDLVSLDLSKTFAAKDELVLSKFKYLRNLRVLKLQGLGLKDPEFSIVAHSIGTRVRSLDLSGNNLTDASARLLLDNCLKETRVVTHETRAPLAPVDHTRPYGEIDTFDIEDIDGHLRKKLTQGFVGGLAIEEARDLGVTHLYVSKNSMTVESISGLLRSGRVQALDIGTLPMVLQRPIHPSSEEADEELELPGVEKLTPILAESASERLTYLRINYRVVTEDAPVETIPSPRAELSGDIAVYTPTGAHELSTSMPPTPELDTAETAVFELPGDSALPSELPDFSQIVAHRSQTKDEMDPKSTSTPAIEVTGELEIKRGPAYAPEPVLVDSPLSPISPILDSSGGLSPNRISLDVSTGLSPPSPLSPGMHVIDSMLSAPSTPSDGQNSRPRSRQNSTYFVEELRARLDLRQSQENRLHPGMLPRVRTLVLTDVPTSTDDPEKINRIIQFIKDCAEEANIARHRARHTYMLPPGRSRTVAEREYARSLFALRRIVFEMAPPQATPKKISTSWRAYPTKSSTEDADSEAFWEAATHDFSFFGDEECGLPNAEPGRHPPLRAMSGLMLNDTPRRPAPPPRPRQPEPEFRPMLDVIGEIGKFRKDRKAAYNAVLQLGELDPDIEGYWPGDITVIRKPVSDDSGALDYYGNRFESGWLYR